MRKIGAWLLKGIIILSFLIIVLFIWNGTKPVVSNGYYKKITTDGEMDSKYLMNGMYEVSYFEQNVMENYKKYEIWYPSEMIDTNRKYPVIIINNGTGVKASKCKASWKRLASWGFIVVANEEEYSWNGFSAEMSLKFLLKLNENQTYGDIQNNPFYNKVDVNNIGISGHSQGGVGTVNAITNSEHSSLYKAAFVASIPNELLAYGLEWEYDASKITIPFFMVAGTGKVDSETILSVEGMKQIFEEITESDMKVMARRNDADHGNMLTYADGYMTAWFKWHLQNDMEASKVFIGENAELINNELYQDQQIIKK